MLGSDSKEGSGVPDAHTPGQVPGQRDVRFGRTTLRVERTGVARCSTRILRRPGGSRGRRAERTASVPRDDHLHRLGWAEGQ